eukprot:6618507-Alexandrium_andersonii.AAC.1
MERGYARPRRTATARCRALRAAALRRLQAGANQAQTPTGALADAVTSHQAAMWRLATRALE